MVTVSFETMSAFDGKTPIIQNGKPAEGRQIRKSKITIELLEQLYASYKRSVPDKSRSRCYFHADGYMDLTDCELISGQNRQKAKEELELAVLEGFLNGSLKWPQEMAWYWQPINDKDFVILREWFPPELTRPNGGDYGKHRSNTVAAPKGGMNHETLDETEKMIEAQGYVDNPSIWRRWIISQVFRNTKSGSLEFHENFIERRPYAYQWDTALAEASAMASMSQNEVSRRERFFKIGTIPLMLSDCLSQLKKDKSGPEEKISKDIERILKKARRAEHEKSWKQMKAVAQEVKKTGIPKLPFAKSEAWVNAFYANGAYFAMDSMIKFHGCRAKAKDGTEMSMSESIEKLDELAARHSSKNGRGFFIAMQKFADDNLFLKKLETQTIR